MTPETSRLIAETLRLDSAATKGPWRWELNHKSRIVQLCGGKPTFNKTILDFKRWGMSSATPRVLGTRDPDLNLMTPMHEFGVVAPDRAHHRDWFQLIEHPDAKAIESFRTSAPRLARMLEVAVKAMTAITAHPDCDVALVEIEKIAKGES